MKYKAELKNIKVGAEIALDISSERSPIGASQYKICRVVEITEDSITLDDGETQENKDTKGFKPPTDIGTAITTLRKLNKKDGLGLYVSDSLEMGARALERHQGKKVVKTDTSSQACPTCKSNVNSKHCSNCGQRLIY